MWGSVMAVFFKLVGTVFCLSRVFLRCPFIRIQSCWSNGLTVPDRTASPAARCPLFGLFQFPLALGQDGDILATVPLLRGYEPQLTVLVFHVVPVHKAVYPASRVVQTLKASRGPVRAVLQSPEQGFRERIVIADPRSAIRRQYAQLFELCLHGLGLHWGSVIRVQHQRPVETLLPQQATL